MMFIAQDGSFVVGDMRPGDREATQEEVDAYNARSTGPSVQLQALDAENTLTQRNLRETIMLMNEAFKTVSNNALDLSAIPGVAKVYEVEAQAAALRAQL
jgi:hypothetical protein